MLLCGIFGTRQAWRNWNQDDHHNLIRVLSHSGLATFVIAGLFGLMTFSTMLGTSPDWRAGLLTAFLVPSVLTRSLPIGILIGTTLGLAGRPQSPRLPSAILLGSVLLSTASFVNVKWIVPAADQRYQQELFALTVPEAERELTLTDMRRAAAELRLSDATYRDPARVRRLTFVSHYGYAIAAAPFTFALFALFLSPRRRLGRMAAVALFCAMTASTVVVLNLGFFLLQFEQISPAVSAWLPHIFVVTATAVVTIVGRLKAAATS
jgi:lipopolysaccharide export LptBFGC system permease protein LptF